jgi:hypothetical protein
MQVIAADAPRSRHDRLVMIRSAATGGLLILAGVLIGWLCLGTPLINSFIPQGRPTTFQTALGVIAWGFAILVPAAFLLFGFARMAHTIDAATSFRPATVTPTLARALGPEHLAATDLRLPGGRRINELVLGPFGILVLGDVPPAAVSRHVGSRWEIRGARGRWVPIEAPLERASRDAERVRGWLSTHDRDFLVRVYAAVVTDDPRVERTPTCAVVKPGDLAGWLEALPLQRGLNVERRESLVALIKTVAGSR